MTGFEYGVSNQRLRTCRRQENNPMNCFAGRLHRLNPLAGDGNSSQKGVKLGLQSLLMGQITPFKNAKILKTFQGNIYL